MASFTGKMACFTVKMASFTGKMAIFLPCDVRVGGIYTPGYAVYGSTWQVRVFGQVDAGTDAVYGPGSARPVHCHPPGC